MLNRLKQYLTVLWHALRGARPVVAYQPKGGIGWAWAEAWPDVTKVEHDLYEQDDLLVKIIWLTDSEQANAPDFLGF